MTLLRLLLTKFLATPPAQADETALERFVRFGEAWCARHPVLATGEGTEGYTLHFGPSTDAAYTEDAEVATLAAAPADLSPAPPAVPIGDLRGGVPVRFPGAIEI